MTNTNLRPMLLPVLAASFCSALGIGAFTFAFPLLAFDASFSGGWLGAAFSGYFVAKTALSPVAGGWSDRFGPKPLLMWPAFAGCVLPLLYFVFPSVWALYLIQIGLGLASGIMRPAAMGLIAASVRHDDAGHWFGWYNALVQGAFFAGPVLGGLLFHDRAHAPVVLFLSGCQLLSGLVAAFYVSRLAHTTTCNRPQETEPFRVTPDMARTMWAIMGRTSGVAALVAFYPILLSQRLHHEPFLSGLLFAVPSLTALTVMVWSGRLADVFDKRMLTICGMLTSAAGLMLLPHCGTTGTFVATGMFIGAGAGLSMPAVMGLAALLNQERKGSTMGFMQAAASSGFIIGPVVCGLAVQWSHSVDTAFMLAGSLGLAMLCPIIMKTSGLRGRLAQAAGYGAMLMVLLMGLLAAAPEQKHNESGVWRYTEVVMGTIANLTLQTPDESTADKAAEEALQLMHSLERDFGHRFTAGDIGRINLNAGKRPVRVSRKTFSLIQRALFICQASNGAFDITIGAVTTSPFYYAQSIPENKKHLINWKLVQTDEHKRTVYLPQKGMAIDLGGLAKGTVIDMAVAQLRESGIAAGIVEAGGDFYCFGPREWSAGLQNPRENGMLGVISVRNQGVCGSGDYQQFVLAANSTADQRKHHIINPEFLASAQKSIGVTVVADTAELADALATTVFIMGPEKGADLLQKKFPSAAAMWVLPNGGVAKTDNFPVVKEQLVY